MAAVQQSSGADVDVEDGALPKLAASPKGATVLTKLSFLAVAAFALLTACSPAKAPEATGPAPAALAEADTAQRNAMLTALTATIEQDLGQKVNFRLETARVEGAWGWVVATPLTLQGAVIDFSKTHYAEQAKEGLLDGDGVIHALMQQVDGAWTVHAFDLGSTDVAWLTWPKDYGAPADLMGLETVPPAP